SLYHITFWFHKEVGGQSVHVAGGNLGLSAVPIVGTARLHQLFGLAVAYVGQLTTAYQQRQFAFTASIHPSAGMTQGTISWELIPAGDAKGVPVYRGKQQALQFAPGTDDATQVTVSESVAIPRGRYDLWIDIDGNGTSGQAQRVVYSNALVQEVDPIFTRQ